MSFYFVWQTCNIYIYIFFKCFIGIPFVKAVWHTRFSLYIQCRSYLNSNVHENVSVLGFALELSLCS